MYLYIKTTEALVNLERMIQVNQWENDLTEDSQALPYQLEFYFPDDIKLTIPYFEKEKMEKDFERILSTIPFIKEGIIELE